MVLGHGIVLALGGLLVAPPPAPRSDFSVGIGYTVSQDLRPSEASGAESSATPSSGAEAEGEASLASAPHSLAPHLPPPATDLARVQGSPRARNLMAAAAIATQVAMIVAGVIAARDQRARARAARRGEAPPYKPYR